MSRAVGPIRFLPRRPPAILPRTGDPAMAFVPLVAGIMVYLATLALVGGLLAAGMVSNWSDRVVGRVTVQVTLPEGDPDPTAQLQQDVARVVAMLQGVAGIDRVSVIDRSRAEALLEPWLGPDLTADLPLPTLIDVVLLPGSRLDMNRLRRRLNQISPRVTLDDHGTWLADLVRIGWWIKGVAAIMVGLVGLTTIATVVYATKSSMKVHRETINVLHVVGATDRFIAGCFAERAMLGGFWGGAFGTITALTTLGLANWGAVWIQGDLLPGISLTPGDWLPALLLPIASGLVSVVAARTVVLQALREMP